MAEPNVAEIVDDLLRKLKARKMGFFPDGVVASQIWLVRGGINAAFGLTFVFLIYACAFPLVCSNELCMQVPFQLPIMDALKYTGLVVALVTFMYALWFTAKFQLQQAIMNLALWDLWKSRILHLKTAKIDG